MKEFPSTEALHFLVGLRASSVVFQPYAVGIFFDDGSFLVSEHFIEHTSISGRVDILDIQKGFDSVSLHRITDHLITSIDRQAFGLSVHFDDGQMIKVVSVPGPLESGHLSHGGLIMVF